MPVDRERLKQTLAHLRSPDLGTVGVAVTDMQHDARYSLIAPIVVRLVEHFSSSTRSGGSRAPGKPNVPRQPIDRFVR
jgi:hypothetical protein